MFYWFIVPAVLMVCVVLWLLIKPDMSTITGKITKTTTRQVTIPIAITVIVVGSILLWVWWDKLSSLALFTWWTLPLAIVFVYGGIAARKDEPVWSKRLFYIACALLLLIGSGHIIFGERFVRDPTAQTAHVVIEGQDPRGVPGDPLYMGHQLNSGRWVRSTNPLTGELFHPSECRPLTPTNVVTIEDGVKKVEVEMLPVPHKGFDYANKGLCRSPTDGTTRLVPWETKHSPIIPDLNPLSTPAELEADEAEKQQRIGAEHQRRVELEKARNPAPDPTLQPITRVIPACGTGWVEIGIPAGRTIKLPWNSAAATYEWRSSATGIWIKEPKESVDKVRICAKHRNYVDDVMTITWAKG
jgi:hypothetical protein